MLDACLYLNYFMSGDSKLNFQFNDNYPFEINANRDEKTINWNAAQNHIEQICIGDWVKSSNTQGSLTFTAEVSDVNKNSVAAYFEKSTKPIENNLLKELPFLTYSSKNIDGFGSNFTLKNQWILPFHHPLWGISDSITFNGTSYINI